ncbi:MAG: hypothetical protein ACKVP4_01830 [Hyphomicrobium sp.]
MTDHDRSTLTAEPHSLDRPKTDLADVDVESALRRFSPALRREVRKLIRLSPRAADLALVFPGLLAALAAKRGGAERRRGALELIDAGAQLKLVARALGMPMWMRRLAPDAFNLGVPDPLPRSERFGRRIAARIPGPHENSGLWLSSVLFAERAASEEFATWIAQQRIFNERGKAEDLLEVLTAYAWYSTARDTEAYKLIAVPWRPEIAFDTALCAAKSWLNRVRLVLQLPPGAITDSWLQAGVANGHSFEPLLDCRQILAEAHAMQNCADQYAERIARHRCRLFSVRRNGQRVATIEVAHHPRETSYLAIMQLKARHNMGAGPDVWQAAYAWMASQQNLRVVSPLLSLNARMTFDQEAWRELMAPYREAKGGAAWFRHEADETMFARHNADMSDVARRAGVTSWLFT